MRVPEEVPRAGRRRLMRYKKVRTTPLALKYIDKKEWWHVHPETMQAAIRMGFVVDRGPAFGGDPDRWVLTDKGREEMSHHRNYRSRTKE